MRQQVLDRAVLLDELRRGLVADARHAGDVVRCVALQRHEVQVLIGTHAVAALDRGRVHQVDLGDAATVEQHGDRTVLLPACPHQLEEVAVRGDDHGVDPRTRRLEGEGADGVVGLVALGADDGDLQGVEHLLDEPELGTELGGCLGAARLVLGIELQADRGGAHVERHGDQVGLLVGEELDQHRGEPVDRVRDRAAAGGQGLRQREERPVREAVAVEEEEPARSRGIVGGHGPYRSLAP